MEWGNEWGHWTLATINLKIVMAEKTTCNTWGSEVKGHGRGYHFLGWQHQCCLKCQDSFEHYFHAAPDRPVESGCVHEAHSCNHYTQSHLDSLRNGLQHYWEELWPKYGTLDAYHMGKHSDDSSCRTYRRCWSPIIRFLYWVPSIWVVWMVL